MAKTRLDYSITTEQLRAALDYDPLTGVFIWKRSSDRTVQWNGKWAGKVAGTPGPNFITIQLRRRRYRANRLAWWFMHGEMPVDMIDHVNGDWRDNRIANLRIATRSQNAANSGPLRTNTSGFKGVLE